MLLKESRVINRDNALIKVLGGLLMVILSLLIVACTGGVEAPAVEQPEEAQAVATETPLPPLGATLPPAEGQPEAPAPPVADEAGAPAPPAEGETSAVANSEAEISSVNVLLLESFPVQVNVLIQGMLPDGCTSIDHIDQQRNNNDFLLMVATIRITTALCMAQRQPFEEIASLDVGGLAAGIYTVTVQGQNQMNSSFELSVDNVLPAGEVPRGSEVQAGISGIVWEDACQLLQDNTPSAGCVVGAEGGYSADGIFDSEEARLAGVEVSLSAGECPGNELLATATSDESGTYSFNDLQPGAYCVSIDPLVEPNASLLLPGSWTYPAPEVGSLAVVVSAGQAQTADFGWDPQFDAPEAPVQGAACLDLAAYVADVTIPDDTVVAPGTGFVKTWRVRNEGDCTWTPDYSLVFAGGEQMSGPTAAPIPQPVAPGAEVDLSVSLVAPLSFGTQRGEWLLQNAAGEVFGSGGEFPFYVQIVVEDTGVVAPTAIPQETGSAGATVTGIVWEDHCSILGNGSPSAECISNGVGGYRANGILDSGEQPIPGVQVKLSAGECPGSQVMFATVETDLEGIYRFSGLQAGPHCLAIEAASEPNDAILLPGDWTYPAPGKGWMTINVGADEIQTFDFGWNYHLQ
jgi:hypothetical protein